MPVLSSIWVGDAICPHKLVFIRDVGVSKPVTVDVAETLKDVFDKEAENKFLQYIHIWLYFICLALRLLTQ